MLVPRLLLTATILYNAAEGMVAVLAGLAAGSVALVSFGGDSALEVAAASVLLWRLSVKDPERAERAEARAVRFIGWTFLALTTVVVYQSFWSFARADGADTSVIGISLVAVSLLLMPALSLWKLKVAAFRNSPALAAEAKETLACSYLSLTLVVGLVANALIGWWWLDPLTALLLCPWLIREGLEGIRGDTCCDDTSICSCRGCWYGVRSCTMPCRTCATECCVPA